MMARRVYLQWDRDRVQDELGVSKKQMMRLSRSPAFPQPIIETRFEIRWDVRDIFKFKKKMETCRRKGWMTPEVLYAWNDTGERETSLKE